MMGSDFPWYDLDTTVEQVRRIPGLSNADRDKITDLNAAEFLGIEA